MTDAQTYERRVARLASARKQDTENKRAAVTKAIQDLRREDRPVTRRAVIARAGVHRNFLYRHQDLAGQIDQAASEHLAHPPRRRSDRISQDSLLTELVTARHRVQELQQHVRALEHRLGAQGPTPRDELIEQHPLVAGLRRRAAEAEVLCNQKDRFIAELQDDIEILRETNRTLVREYGLIEP